MFHPRTLHSAARTGVYGTLATALAITDPQTLQMLDAALLGFMLADYGTWLAYNLIALPEELWHGAYDAVINTIFGMFLFSRIHIGVYTEGSALAAGFAACLATLFVKVIIYAGDYLRDVNEDGL